MLPWLVFLVCAEASSQPAIFERTLSQDDGLIYVQVFKDQKSLAAGASHDHVIRAGRWHGKLAYQPSVAQSCRIEVEIEIAAMIPDEPALLKRVGFDNELSESLRENMLDDEQLAAKKFPNIRFGAVKNTEDILIVFKL